MDKILFDLVKKEEIRQKTTIELIASENIVSKQVMEVAGSVLTNKYAEGYPQKRYYGGCEVVDEIENLAISRVCQLFGCDYANVQPHSGTQANTAVYRAFLKHGDTVLGMDLVAGGHLTHGHPLNLSGKDYNFICYNVDPKTHLIDYDNLLNLALEFKPKMIIAGASAYSREIDFKKFKEIASKVGAILMVDMAHIAGLIAAKRHMNPFPYADVVTSTTHKTLRGPRGGIILTNSKEMIDVINKEVFPGIQGGPLMHIIGAKATSFYEALKPEFKDYVDQLLLNNKAMYSRFIELGAKVITNGSDNHLFLLDVNYTYNMSGKDAQILLDSVNITTNKNTIPYDTLKPFITSGLRLGSAAMTSFGLKEEEFIKIADLIDMVLKDDSKCEYVKIKVKEILQHKK